MLKDKLTANLVPFADNVKVQVEFNPAQVKGYRLIGYENRALADEDFRNDAVDAGDVGPNSQFTVVYEVALADSKQEINEPELKYGADAAAGDASGDWLTCSLRYHAFDGDEMREQQLDVGPSSVMGTPSADWSLAAAVCEFGMLLRDSTYAGTSSEDSILELLANAANDEQVSSLRRLVTDARLGYCFEGQNAYLAPAKLRPAHLMKTKTPLPFDGAAFYYGFNTSEGAYHHACKYCKRSCGLRRERPARRLSA